MEIRMHGIYLVGKQKALIDVFAYSGKGLPGIEIKGPRKGLEQLREKFIYITRNRGLKIPLKKITLCVESKAFEDSCKGAQYSPLELPLLILFWNLCEFISIHNLQNCLCAGCISIEGKIQNMPLQDTEMVNFVDKNLIWITTLIKDSSPLPILPLEEILGSIPNLHY